jgi:hypothetical protein
MNGFRAAVFGLIAIGSMVTARAAAQNDCHVAITVPHDGGNVSETDDVRGTGKIPGGAYLWIFAHRKGLALWWPEGGGPATITNGEWDVTATFGQARDKGHPFEISAAVVDQSTHDKLVAWVKKTNETGQYPGMDHPTTVQGCAPVRLTVTKAE